MHVWSRCKIHGSGLVFRVGVDDGCVWKVRMLGHEIHGVNAVAIDPFIEPESHVGVGGATHVFAHPIEIGLRRQEEAEIILLAFFIPSPGITTKDGSPVVGRLLISIVI